MDGSIFKGHVQGTRGATPIMSSLAHSITLGHCRKKLCNHANQQSVVMHMRNLLIHKYDSKTPVAWLQAVSSNQSRYTAARAAIWIYLAAMAYPYGHPSKVSPGCTRQIPCKASETAVLVIDVQEYCSRAGQGVFAGTSRSELPYFFDRVDQTMVPNIAILLKAARQACTEVIYTVIEALTFDGRDQSLDYKLRGPLFVPKGHSSAAVLQEIMPDADDIILPKTSCSVFCSTNIAYVLRNLGVRYLLVRGQLTNQCVESAVRDAADLGFLVTVVDDACAAKSAEEHASGLHNMKGFARVMSTKDLQAELLEQVQPHTVGPVIRPKRSICYLNVAYDQVYGATVIQMLMEMFEDVGANTFELQVCNVANDAFPNCNDFDGFILMGSVSSCASGSKNDSWLPKLLGFLQKLVREERPLVGVCFGHQAICRALGGTVIINPAGTQSGLQRYPMSDNAKTVLNLAQESLNIFSHHADAVALLPKEATSWGYCHSGHWGMSMKNCLSTQAHPEFSTKTGLQTLKSILENDKCGSSQTSSLREPSVEEIDSQIRCLDKPTDYKSIAMAFAHLLKLMPLMPDRKRPHD